MVGRPPELGHFDDEFTLARLNPPRPHAVAPAAGQGCAFVAGARQELGHFLLHSALDNELSAEAPQLAQAVRIPVPAVEQIGDACSSRALAGILFSTVQSSFGGFAFHHGDYTVSFLQHLWDATLFLPNLSLAASR